MVAKVHKVLGSTDMADVFSQAECNGNIRRSKRAIRRKHIARLKKARRTYYYWPDHPLDRRQLGMIVNTVPACSCWMCGNPRRHLKELTIQEQKALLDTQEQIDLFYSDPFDNDNIGWSMYDAFGSDEDLDYSWEKIDNSDHIAYT